jgi:hypothetical protein
VRVVEQGLDPGFVPESLEQAGDLVRRGEDFHRDGGPGSDVNASINLAHAAGTEKLDQPVVADRTA